LAVLIGSLLASGAGLIGPGVLAAIQLVNGLVPLIASFIVPRTPGAASSR
jgi:hypothetical protein